MGSEGASAHASQKRIPITLIDPQVGDYYRQEFALGDAEDMGEVISRDEEAVSVPFGEYNDDVLKTRDWTPIEPGKVLIGQADITRLYWPTAGLWVHYSKLLAFGA